MEGDDEQRRKHGGPKLHGATFLLLENMTVTQLVRKLQALYGILSFVTVFSTALRGPYLVPDESSPYPLMIKQVNLSLCLIMP
jgi:hypothetical protein